MAEKTFHVYTDGACKVRNGKMGSWAFVILDCHGTLFIEKTGVVENTTSPVMELQAVFNAMGVAWDELPSGNIVIHSDSKFVVNGINEWMYRWKKNKWKGSQGNPVKHQEIWKEVLNLYERVKPKVKWVRGHNGNHWNEYVDKLATSALKQ